MIDTFGIGFRGKHFSDDFFVLFIGFGEKLMKDVFFDFKSIGIGQHVPVA